MTATMSAALPSFRTFLEATRHCCASPVAVAPSPPPAFTYGPPPPSMMGIYELALISAREWERTCQGDTSSSSSTVSSDAELSDHEDPASVPAPSSSSSPSPVSSPYSSDARPVHVKNPSSIKLSPSKPSSGALRAKKKYLKEKQRYEIVRRVRGGEKQAHLAKEFGVSRAAVCYLLKHQAEILSRRGLDEHQSC